MKRTLSILLAALLLLFALPTVAEEVALQEGLFVSDAGTEFMYLNGEGVGVLTYGKDGQAYANGICWTGTSLEIERLAIPFASTDGVLSFTYDNTAFALKYFGASQDFALGGEAYAGVYRAEDGKTLTLTPDGRGVYGDGSGEKDVFWGSLLPYWTNAEEGTYFLLFDSYLSGLTFADGKAVVKLENEEEVTFLPEQPAAKASAITIISPALDLGLTLPTDGWTVEENEAALTVYRDPVQYTFLSLALETAPSAATLNAYADHLWTDVLMGAGVAYEAGETVRTDHAVGEAAGRAAATEWTLETGAQCKGDAVLWYANGRLYGALCVSDEATRTEALALLDQVLSTFRTAEEAEQGHANMLSLDKAAIEGLRDVTPVVEVTTDQVYYGYRITTGGQSLDLIPLLTAMGMDPKGVSLVLRSNGTGRIQIMDDDSSEFTWTEEVFAVEGESVPYTREGEHIVLTLGDEVIEFAPAAEIDALMDQAEEKQNAEDVIPTAADLAGNWIFTKAKAMGLEIPAEQMGSGMSLAFHEDGTVTMLSDGAPSEMEWVIQEDGKVSMSAEGIEIFELSFDGTVLTLTTAADSVQMVFEKEN